MSILLILAAVLSLGLGQSSTHSTRPPHIPHANHTQDTTSVSPSTGPTDIPTLMPAVVGTDTTPPPVSDTATTPVTDTIATSSDTTPAPVGIITTDNIDINVPTTPFADSTTSETTATTEASSPIPISSEPPRCQPRMSNIAAVYNFTNERSFLNLGQHEQVLIYELLAASENCTLKNFIDAQTAQRIFLVTEDLPLRQVYKFISFLARSLEAEGITVPVV